MKIKLMVLLFCIGLVSCESDEDSLQKIDQSMQIYIQNAQGDDLLNTSNNGKYATITLLDLGGEFTETPLQGSYQCKEN